MLSDDGILFLTTPNFALYKSYGNNWYGFKTSFEHLFYMSIDSFTSLYNGKFKIIDFFTDCHLAKPSLFLFDKINDKGFVGGLARSILGKSIRNIQASVMSNI